MKTVTKALVASVALAFGAQAQAAIDSDNGGSPTTGTGAGELFLSVVDRGGAVQRSYVLDLGYTAADFLANDASFVNNISIAADANLLDIINNVSGSIAWNLAAAHNFPGPTNDDFGYLTTSPTPLVANVNTQTGFTGMSEMNARIDSYLDEVNGPADTDVSTDNSKLFGAADNAFYDGPLWGDQWTVAHSTEGALDSDLGFYFVAMDFTNDPTTASSRVAEMLGNWSLSSDGLLTYSSDVGAPVPVPAAVWLLGSALVGLVGVARRKSEEQA